MHHTASNRPQYPQQNQFIFHNDWILYADQEIVIANKPSGLLSVPGRGADKQESLISHLLPIYPTIKIIHRLDMDTSGLMVLALTPQTHRYISRQFQERETFKTYHAICAGIPSQKQGMIKLPMRCNWEKRPLQMIDFKAGKSAETHWKLLQQYEDSFLAELTPITGRSHQLRLHMKSLGHPILGDNLYADPITLNNSNRLQLHATTLSFKHPANQQIITFTTPNHFKILQTK